ncbi:MAG: sugar ABC transporter permease [Firmicutes bacterium]|jgi:ABC transporter, permease protein|nr:sugar ABC transporter permease [Bacillota bacterium]
MKKQPAVRESGELRRTRTRKELKKMAVGYAFIGPVVLGLLIFNLYPVIYSFILSFFKTYNGIGVPSGFGVFNYMKMFNGELEQHFFKSLGITFEYTLITVPLSMVLSFALAVLLNSNVKGIGIFRACCYLPVVIPVTIMGLLWSDFYNTRFGLANEILTSLGLPPSQFFDAAASSMPTLIFNSLWGLGGGMVLWLSSLKSVPKELYESANIDGANAFVRMFRVTIPMCTPIIFYNLVLNIISSLQNYANVMTLGIPNGSGVDQCLYFYAYKIYETAFRGREMGYASALAWVLFVIIAALTALTFKTSKWVYYEE